MKLVCLTVVIALTLGAAPSFAADRPVQPAREGKQAPEQFRLGPLVGIGFPRPFSLEAFVKLERTIGLGIEYSFLPRTTVSNVSTRFDAIAADARWFPFKGAFFIGLRGGRQWLSGRAALEVANFTFTESADAATWFINPRIGLLHTWQSGMTIGIDAGVQLPINASFERSGPATSAGFASNEVDSTLRTVANTFGNGVTPTLDLLRLGFLF